MSATIQKNGLRQHFLNWYNNTTLVRTDAQIQRERYLFGTLGIESGPEFNRWTLLPAAVLIQLSVGSLYAWSNYNSPLDALMWGADNFKANPSLAQAPNVFYVAVGFFGLSAATLGPWLERRGPVQALLLGVTLFMLGHIVAAIGAFTQIYALVFLGYGCIAGIGFGLTYISPVSPLQKWFPDKRGLASGFAVAGFGGGTTVASYYISYLITTYGVGYSFLITGITYAGIMYTLIPTFRVPPPGYIVKNIAVDVVKGSESEVVVVSPTSNTVTSPTRRTFEKSEKGIAVVQEDTNIAIKDLFNRRDLLQLVTSMDFILMYLMLMANSITGLLIVSRLSNMVQQLFGKPAYEGTTMVAINSLVNMAGRIIFSSMSDMFGRRPMFIFTLTVQIASIYGILASAHQGVYGGFLFCIFAATMCYGAGFGLIPAFLADMFGAKMTGATHGFILTAWSFDGVVGGLMFTAIYNSQIHKIPGTTLVDPASYDIDFYWVSAVVMMGWIVTVFFVRTDLKARFLPLHKGEIIRSRLFGSLFLIGTFGIRRMTKSEEEKEWNEYLIKARTGQVVVGKLLNGGRPRGVLA
ncbi:hypothetical protein SmJEL517_g02556 [Synchytrium microbalum]|uniref:Major facilitator superfamily (MFS) profile domain-containing protein n=1 Tax=Synchytrium microbalum TaxID=1806994 RepID=A0A507C154_9FUNG|nr:uncharacterized protein SmJEL517_g02556 [Synchytrium microbalum]TPX34827.1 hypothetical protein SmJEL517_g02556 [Synchytrium microbalum]